MKLRYWSFIWVVILSSCIIIGIKTHESFTKFSPESAVVLNSYYSYPVESDGLSNVNCKKLVSSSSLVIEAQYTGERIIQNKCYLSNIQVKKVIKGNLKMQGNIIQVFEPVFTRNVDSGTYMGSAYYPRLKRKFNWGNNSNIIVSYMNASRIFYGYSMFSKGKKYIIFLNEKQYPSQLVTKPRCFVLNESPYAKIEISNTSAESYRKPNENIALKDSFQYEILLRKVDEIQTYFRTKREILHSLHIM